MNNSKVCQYKYKQENNYTIKCDFIDTENKLHGLMIHKLILKNEMALLYSIQIFHSSKLT